MPIDRRLVLALVPLFLALAAASGCGGDPGGGGSAAAGSTGGTGSSLLAGVAAVPITPTAFESWSDLDGDGDMDSGEPFEDTGTDRLWSYQEAGALGPDGQPGRAHADDDGNGTVDDPSEYLALGSDDVPDPAGDDHDAFANPGGTEGDGVFQSLVLAGFGGFITGLASFNWQGEYRYATGVHDDLWARAIAFERNGTRVVLVSCDLVGMLHGDINPIKRRVEQTYGVPFSNIVIASTHVHSGPDPVGIWAGRVDDVYMQYVRDRVVQAIATALQGMRPCRITSTHVEPPSGIQRQTGAMVTAPFLSLGDTLDAIEDPTQGWDEITLQTDLRDPFVRNTEIGILRLDDDRTGQTFATLVNWHDHPEVLGDDNIIISSDFPHYLREMIERRLGGVCVYFSGTVGGQIGALHGTRVPLRDAAGTRVLDPTRVDAFGNPLPVFVSGGTFDTIRSIGYEVADEAVAALQGVPPTQDPGLSIRTEDLDIDIETLYSQIITRLVMLRPGADPRDLPFQAPYFSTPMGGIRTQISVVDVGDVEIVTAPGEIFPDHFLGRRASTVPYSGYPTASFPAMTSIRAAMGGRDRMVFGLANTYLGYLIPESDFLPIYWVNHPNFYEEMVSPGPFFGDNVGTKLLQMLGSPVRFSGYPIHP